MLEAVPKKNAASVIALNGLADCFCAGCLKQHFRG